MREVDVEIMRLVRIVVIAVVVVTAGIVSIIEEVAVAGNVETAVVVIWYVDCGMLRQEQVVEIAVDAKCLGDIC